MLKYTSKDVFVTRKMWDERYRNQKYLWIKANSLNVYEYVCMYVCVPFSKATDRAEG